MCFLVTLFCMVREPIEQAHFRNRAETSAALAAAGYIQVKKHRQSWRIMDCYAIVYILGGGGFYADSLTSERPIAAGQVLVLFPGLAHRYGPGLLGQTWDEGFLVFHGECFAGLERDGLLDRRRPVWSPGLAPAQVEALDALIAGFRVGTQGNPQRTVARIHHLLVELAASDRRGGGALDRLAAAKARLVERLDTAVDLERLALEVGMSYETFRKRFVASEGVSPARWRQQRRIDRAKVLLAESDARLGEIAAQLGYCDQFFFSRQFKRVAGVTPGAFRVSVRGRSAR